MIYREFGKTGEKISALGFGCMRFPEVEIDGKKCVDTDKTDEMLKEAFERGINYFDTAPYYCNSDSELAFKFCLGNPNLSCALSGMQTLDMVKKNTAIASGDVAFSEEEWRVLGDSMEQLKKFSDLYCTGCKYCQPCPAGIEIPKIFNMFTYKNVYELSDHAQWMFNKYVEDGGCLSDKCLNCGFCERKCPQHLKIRDNLKMVEALFNK